MIYESATLINYQDISRHNGTDFESVIKVAAVQSGSHLYDNYRNTSYDYTQSNLARGILFSKLFTTEEKITPTRQEFWCAVHKAAVDTGEDILVVRDLRSGYLDALDAEMKVKAALTFMQTTLSPLGYSADVNIHLHRAEIPHCHFLLPLINPMSSTSIKDIVSYYSLDELKRRWVDIQNKLLDKEIV